MGSDIVGKVYFHSFNSTNMFEYDYNLTVSRYRIRHIETCSNYEFIIIAPYSPKVVIYKLNAGNYSFLQEFTF